MMNLLNKKNYVCLLIVSFMFISSTFNEKIKTSEGSVLTTEAENIAEVVLANKKIEQLDSLLTKSINSKIFNGSIMVSIGNKYDYYRSFGFSNFQTKDSLNSQSIFQLASVSKQFTAMAIMLLHEKGKLDYEDNAIKYLPDLPYENITIRQLLNHTTGLPNYMWLLEHHWKSKDLPYNTDVIELLAEHNLHLYFKPGTRFDYSNTGYILLASIVEKISNEKFADFITKNIFLPLGMNNSFVYSRALDRKYIKKLNGYRRYRRRYLRNSETVHDGVVGDKGIYSTTEDLCKWDQALYTEILVSKETLEEAFVPLTLKNNNHWQYGFGFRLKELNGQKIAYHYGAWNGFKTCLIRYLNDKNTVIVLNNSNHGLYGIVRRIESILYPPAKDNDQFTLAQL